MPTDDKDRMSINYTAREFGEIRQELIKIAERYYPDTFRDFSEGSFGAMMVDAVAYIGDQLSFYLDYGVNESFLDTSYNTNNILRHGRIMGFKQQGPSSTFGKVAMFVLVPASATGIGPDRRYMPIVKRGTSFTSQNGLNFVLTEDVNVNDSKNQIITARTDSTTGAPTFYAVRCYGSVVSGRFGNIQVEVGAYERYKRVSLKNANIAEIISVFDSDGNEYFEVDNLSQDTIFEEIPNVNFKNDNVPSIMKPTVVARRFITTRTAETTFIQFGTGQDNSDDVIASPEKVALNLFGKDYVTDTTFDPTKTFQNQNNGTVPTNTTLTIRYRLENANNSNVSTGGVNRLSSVFLEFENEDQLSRSLIDQVRTSIEVNNEEPIIGRVTTDFSPGAIKDRIYNTFSAQNRAVTQQDYESLVYQLPAKFGAVKRCSIQRDPSSQRRNLNLYVVSEDSFGSLIQTNSTIKNNLKTWLNHYRMLSDTIDILDPYIINLGLDFKIVAKTGINKFDVLQLCINRLQNEFLQQYYIGEHVSLSKVYDILNRTNGVLDVVAVRLINKTGTNYSSSTLDINDNLSPDGTYLECPKNAIFEFKFPRNDIKGGVL